MSLDSEKKVFPNKYGYFTEDGSEYVITDPKTPRPWVNVNCNEDYGYVVSQTGGGFSWYGNSQLSRMNIWYQDLVKDDHGKYIYVRDNKSKRFWSTTWKPTCARFTTYEARYGLGYTRFTTLKDGIRTEQLMFVPRKDSVEIWKLRITNESRQKRSLSFFTYLELCLGNGTDTHREFQKTFIETRIDRTLGAMLGYKRPALVPGFISTGAKDAPLSAFLALLNKKPTNYDGDEETFLGMYGTTAAPKAVREGALTPKRAIEKWGDPCFSLQADIELKAGETKELTFLFGRVKKLTDARHVIKKFKQKGVIDKELQAVKKFWEKITEASWIDTPDKAMDFLTNKWYRYQAISARMWAKTAYYQCSGGIGFRDQLQDSNCLLESDPDLTRKQILTHAAHQFSDGTVYHWWHPGTGIGAHTEMTDDLLWLAFVSLNYYEETDDHSLFLEKVPFVNVDAKQKPQEATIYEHCCLAIDKVLSRWSKRGLPLIGEGDWNDGMSHVGLQWKGESIWLGHFLYGVLQRFAEICVLLQDKKRATRYLSRAKKLKTAINKHGWDGKWYIRATRDNGIPLGSKTQRRGKIFLNAQSWAVINGTATPQRARIAMNSAYTFLFQKYGPLLFTPGYDVIDPTIGYLSRYAPSVRENGGVYTHAASWGVQAAAIMGDADKAYSGYKNMCPVYRALRPDLYLAEPYVTPGNVDGPDSDKFGRGGWTWYSGSGSWMQKVAYNWICGIRASKNGLIIDPCIPKQWKGFRAKRTFRGSTYYITVKNPQRVSKGVAKLSLNGQPIKGNSIPVPPKKGTYTVLVTLG
jgi:cellobiose phosphorylase